MPTSSLEYPLRSFVAETAWINSCFDRVLPRSSAIASRKNEFDLSAEMAVVQLHDAWSRFCREVVILSAGCEPLTASGKRLSRAPSIASRADVIPTLLSTFKKARYEPRWGDSTICIDAARRLNISNIGTFAAAVGAANSTAEEVRKVRNFFAHRNQVTATQVRSHFSHPNNLVLNIENTAAQLVTPGITRLESWVINLRAVAEAAIQ